MTDSTEEDAKKIVQMLVKKGLKANETMANAMVQSNALELGLQGAPLDNALTRAGDNGWIETPSPGWTALTQAGHTAGQAT